MSATPPTGAIRRRGGPRCPRLAVGTGHLPWMTAMIVLAGATPAVGQAGSTYEALQTFSSVVNHIRTHYVDSVATTGLVWAAIDGMLRSLDPHSRFIPREDVERAQAVERGDLGTAGFVLADVDAMPTVLSVDQGGPADRNGVQPGDRLQAIDDTAVAGRDAEALMLRLAGVPGSRVRLRFERGPRLEPHIYHVTIRREPVRQASVVAARMLDTATGYVRLARLGPGAAAELAGAIDDLRSDGATQLLLDLRGNPGGGVLAAVDVASLFLPRASVVFRTRGRSRTADEDYVTRMAGPFDDIPLIVLIDERSASGSEALAGCLQDHDRALLIGRRSFGKALLQSPYALPYGDLLWLTTGRVLTPSGRFIQRHYAGLAREQYYGLAGHGGTEQDTARVFRTDAHRVVRGGGGIRPDVEMPPPVSLPTWHAVAASAGLEEAVADSIAFTLPATDAARAAWISNPQRWGGDVLAPFLERVRTRLDVAAEPDTARDALLARRLAARVALVRWGPEAREDLLLGTDPSVREASRAFPRLTSLLAGPTK